MIDRVKQLRRDTQRLLREDYPESLEALELLPERIATEKERLTSIRSSLSEKTGGRSSAADLQDRSASIIITIDRLKAELTVARLEISVIDKILATLTTEQRHCVDLFDLNRQRGAVDRLADELAMEKTAIYDIYNSALDKIARLYWGRR